MSSLIRAAFQSATKPCPHCGRWTFASRFTAVTDEVAALLGVQPDAEVAEDCRDRAEQELDAAEAELALDDDTAAQWAAVVRGGDVLDRAVSL